MRNKHNKGDKPDDNCKEDREILPQEKDRHLDIPSEANRDKHINFLESDQEDKGEAMTDKEIKERHKQWEKGLEEGKKARDCD